MAQTDGKKSGSRAPRLTDVADRYDKLCVVVRQAREEARTILAGLERAGHPQTQESSSLYLGLVAMHKELSRNESRRPHQSLPQDLKQLETMCGGALASVLPLIQQAIQLANGGRLA